MSAENPFEIPAPPPYGRPSKPDEGGNWIIGAMSSNGKVYYQRSEQDYQHGDAWSMDITDAGKYSRNEALTRAKRMSEHVTNFTMFASHVEMDNESGMPDIQIQAYRLGQSVALPL